MNKEKAYIFPRIIAYLIDIIIVSVISSMFTFFLPTNNITEIQEEYKKLEEKYKNSEISSEIFLEEYQDLSYELDYASVLSSIIGVTVVICYFVVFQYYNKGQTLGKKLMKIQVVNNGEESLTINQFVYRSIILNGLFVNIVMLFLILFMNKNYYFYVSFPLQMIQEVLLLITMFMVLFRKDGRGLHDKLAGTKVVMCD